MHPWSRPAAELPDSRPARREPLRRWREAGAGELVVGQVERLCGVAEAAPLRPVTVDADELLHAVRDAGTLRSYLLSQRLDVDQLQMVTMAADPTRSAHATLVALQAGVGPEKSARILVGDSTVAIVDTAAGRICVESVTSGQRRYQVLSPGSRSDIGGAVQRLIRRLPAGDEWYSYRRVV